MTYSIFQLPIENDNTFMSHSFTEKHGGVKISDYKTVYTGQIDGTNVNEILEKLYSKFNTDHPADYRARSLSVSDLVALEGTGTYFCDSFGWKQIS